ncbi:MAG: SUMF1/EgtB/PvdO family nonheme iron enzyme [Candidatus Competibacteraceae bacterium]
MPEETNALPTGYSLHRYQIDGVLGAGGFGITYLAIHEALENRVAIKEYFPAEWAYRDHNGTTVRANAQGQIPARNGEPPCYDWGLQRFLDEAKILVQINHPGVVRVRDYFTANGSAYIVMEYEEGESLSAALQRSGILPEQDLRRLLNDVMPALEAVHGEGYLHRDIKPSNLYIRSHDDHMILIDFGAARQALGRRTRSVTSVVTPGYSPIEQYVTVGEDYGPWTDIYALGAVLYRCITGAPPVEAPGRVLKDPMQPAMEVGAGLYSRGLLQVVDLALAVRPEDRFHSIVTMREALDATDQSPADSHFSPAPHIRSDLLELSPLTQNLPSLEPPVAPGPISLPSQRDIWSDSVPLQVHSRNSQPQLPERDAPPSHPSQRVDTAPSSPDVQSPSWSFAEPKADRPFDLDSAPPVLGSPAGVNADPSLPLLENIWEQLDELTPHPPLFVSEPIPLASPPQSQSASTSLLKRTPRSALEHLKKASNPRWGEIITSDRPIPQAPSSLQTSAAGQESGRVGLQDSAVIAPGETGRRAPAIRWTRILMTVFVVSGLSGMGLLAFQYYSSFRDQSQREAAAQQQRLEQEEAARHAQATQRQEAEITRYVEQARRAITGKNWSLAATYLERAATVDPDHPAVAAAQTELLAAQQPTTSIRTRTDPMTGLELNWVEGACFTIGSPAAERDRRRDEPERKVCVKGFWIGKVTITNDQYRRFKPDHDSGSLAGHSLNGSTQPAVNLNWGDAKAFAEWLSWEAGAGQRFRLPTEAEWEFAARAGTTTRYYWGDDIDPRHANFSDRNDPTGAAVGNLDDGHAVTAPVGSYLPNPLGLRDMAGNVWEWTCSEYDPNYGGEEQRCSTRRSDDGQRVVRGGSWNNGPGDLRSARRLPRNPGHRDEMTGFRVLMEGE